MIRDDEDGPERGRLRALLALVLLATIVGGAVDLWFDAPETWLSPHVIYEMALIIVAMLTSALLWRGWWRSRGQLLETRTLLAQQAADRDAWRASAQAAIAGFGQAINQRFDAWRLTPVEREVALLLLKGRSHKQIAFETARSERTVRQHAVSIYQKSGLTGRAELAAFFLEDVPLPTEAATSHA